MGITVIYVLNVDKSRFSSIYLVSCRCEKKNNKKLAHKISDNHCSK